VLLGKGERDPVIAVNLGAGRSPVVLIGDHAGRAIPAVLGNLGLAAPELERHIARDIGVADLGPALARAMDAPFISQAYSRLVIDCNRDPARADSICEVSDETAIPGNAGLTQAQRASRIEAIFKPYHAAISDLLDARKGRTKALIAVHSFTPVFQGFVRPWRFGVLHRSDSPLSRAMLAVLREAEGAELVGDNEPYAMDTVDYTIPHHADARALDYVELEVRQDLISTPADAEAMALHLAPLLDSAVKLTLGT
jgi:predicted N-formylglutamate amidohydrolase